MAKKSEPSSWTFAAPIKKRLNEIMLSCDEQAAYELLEDPPDPMPEVGRKQIVRALTSGNSSLRKMVWDYLRHDWQPELNVPLLKALLEVDLAPSARTDVLEALWTISPCDVLAGLYLWNNANRVHATRYLSGSADTPTQQVIDCFLSDSNPRIRAAAITAQGIVTGSVEPAVAALLQECEKGDYRFTYDDLSECLVRMLPAQTKDVERLCAGLESDALDCVYGPRKVAARILAISTDITALRPLILHLIATAITDVRVACLKLLERFGEHPVAVPTVAAALESIDPWVCYNAINCLATVAGRQAFDLLASFVATCKWPKVRQRAEEILFSLHPTIEQLETLAHSVNTNVLVDELSLFPDFDAVDRLNFTDKILKAAPVEYQYAEAEHPLHLLWWLLERVSSTTPSEDACQLIERLLIKNDTTLRLSACVLAEQMPITLRPLLPALIAILRDIDEDVNASSVRAIQAMYLSSSRPEPGQVAAIPLVLESRGYPDRFMALLAAHSDVLTKLKVIAHHWKRLDAPDTLVQSFLADFTVKQLGKGQLLGFDVVKYMAVDPWLMQAFRNWLSDLGEERAKNSERMVSQGASEVLLDTYQTMQEDPQAVASLNEECESIHRELDQLSRAVDREVIRRRFFYGQQFHEICEELHITKSAAEVALARGLKKLAQGLAPFR